MNNDVSLKIGTASGTLLSLVPNILSEDIVRTVILAVLGAVVSFAVTVLLKWFTRSKKK
jgi:H+/Cl- antiporter ClcA